MHDLIGGAACGGRAQDLLIHREVRAALERAGRQYLRLRILERVAE